MKLFKQILSLLLITLLFGYFNFSLYVMYTSRCANNFSDAMGMKVIEPEKYLPFDEDSLIVKADSTFKLTDNLPVLDGAAALLPVYSAVANAVYPAESCVFDGENYTSESAVQFTNTVRAYKGVVDGNCDLIFCAAPSEAQLQYAEEQGVELVFVPIGYEAFVFIVNENNPVENLTADQIRGIYSGEYVNWSEVGGADRFINPLDRIEGSGSQTVMLNFMGEKEIKKSPVAFLGATIGFSFRYYVEGIVGNSGVKMISVDGVYPDRENIRNGTYPLVYNFYAVYRADNKSENVKALVDWILSEEGQYIIDQSGYVSLN